MRAAAYVRVSTKPQADLLTKVSLPKQREIVRKMAETDGVPLLDADIFQDAKTGRMAERPGWQALKARLSEYDRVYMLASDRLGRRVSVAAEIRETLRRAHVTLRLSVGDTSTLDYESRVLLESVQDSQADAEVARLVRRTYPARRERAKRGLHGGRLPVGWVVVRDARTGRSIGAAPDKSWDRFYSDLEDLFLQGIPWNALPRQMAARGHTSPYPDRKGKTGKQWSLWTLANIVRSELNMGRVTFAARPRRTLLDQVLPAEATATMREKSVYGPRWKNPPAVAAEVRRRAKMQGRGRWPVTRLAGVLRCFGVDSCGGKMTSAGSEPRSYRCAKHAGYLAHQRVDDCNNPQSITETSVMRQLRDWFQRLHDETRKDERALDRIVDGMLADRGPSADVSGLASRLAELDGKLEGFAKRLPSLPEALLPVVVQEAERMAAEREDVRKALVDVERHAPPPVDRDTIRRRIVWAETHADELLAAGEPWQTAKMLTEIFPDGVGVWDGKVVILDGGRLRDLRRVV